MKKRVVLLFSLITMIFLSISSYATYIEYIAEVSISNDLTVAGNLDVGMTLNALRVDTDQICIGPTGSRVCRTTWPADDDPTNELEMPGGCANNQVAKYNSISGLWTCGNDNVGSSSDDDPTNEIQDVITNQGLTKNIGDDFGLQPCASGEILIRSGSSWICQVPNDGDNDPNNEIELPLACASGSIPKSDGLGGWTCDVDLTYDSSDPGIPVACGDGFIARYDVGNTRWECSAPELPISCAQSEVAKYNATGMNWYCGSLLEFNIDDSACVDGSIVSWSTAKGMWECSAPELPTGCGPDQIAKYNATGLNWYCDDSISDDLQARVNGTCSEGSSITKINEDGSVVCSDTGMTCVPGSLASCGPSGGIWLGQNCCYEDSHMTCIDTVTKTACDSEGNIWSGQFCCFEDGSITCALGSQVVCDTIPNSLWIGAYCCLNYGP